MNKLNIKTPPLGAHYLFEGFKLIMQKRLRRFVVIPLILNIIFFSVFLLLGIHFFNQALHWLDNLLPSWLHWLHWLLWPLFFISCLAVFAYFFTFVALIIAAPFNGLLSEKVETLLSDDIIPQQTFWQLVADMPRIIGREIRKLLYYLPRALGLLLLFLIPIVQLAAPFFWFLFTAWTMAMLYVDYPMDNHRVSFKQMCQQMRRQPLLHISFGAVVVLLTLFPFLNLLIMPAAVAGATKLYVEHYRQ